MIGEQKRIGIEMHLEAAQKNLWIHQQEAPRTTQEALARVSQALLDCINAFQEDQLVEAQISLEDTLAQVLIALKSMNIQADRAVERCIERMEKAGAEGRVFHIYKDRVEIQVGMEIRGGWPLFSNEDYEAALALARTFGCEVAYHEAQQLNLFRNSKPPSRTAPTHRQRTRRLFTGRVRPRLTLISGADSPNPMAHKPSLT